MLMESSACGFPVQRGLRTRARSHDPQGRSAANKTAWPVRTPAHFPPIPSAPMSKLLASWTPRRWCPRTLKHTRRPGRKQRRPSEGESEPNGYGSMEALPARCLLMPLATCSTLCTSPLNARKGPLVLEEWGGEEPQAPLHLIRLCAPCNPPLKTTIFVGRATTRGGLPWRRTPWVSPALWLSLLACARHAWEHTPGQQGESAA